MLIMLADAYRALGQPQEGLRILVKFDRRWK